jgi:hypothetical protein
MFAWPEHVWIALLKHTDDPDWDTRWVRRITYSGEIRGYLINKHCDIGTRSFKAPNTKEQDREVGTRTAHHNLSALDQLYIYYYILWIL